MWQQLCNELAEIDVCIRIGGHLLIMCLAEDLYVYVCVGVHVVMQADKAGSVKVKISFWHLQLHVPVEQWMSLSCK